MFIVGNAVAAALCNHSLRWLWVPAFAGTTIGRALPHPHLPGFPTDHRLLAGDAPVIAGQRAALAECAMAGHHERNRVLADGRAHRARRLRALDLFRDVRIA